MTTRYQKLQKLLSQYREHVQVDLRSPLPVLESEYARLQKTDLTLPDIDRLKITPTRYQELQKQLSRYPQKHLQTSLNSPQWVLEKEYARLQKSGVNPSSKGEDLRSKSYWKNYRKRKLQKAIAAGFSEERIPFDRKFEHEFPDPQWDNLNPQEIDIVCSYYGVTRSGEIIDRQSLRDIAARLGVSQNAIHKRLKRLRKLLNQSLL